MQPLYRLPQCLIQGSILALGRMFAGLHADAVFQGADEGNCSGKLISPVLAGSFQVLSTYVMKLFFGLYDGFPWKSIRRDADSGNIW